MSQFPQVRMRRLRRTPAIRRLFDAPLPGPEKFIWPLFIAEGSGKREAIEAMPDQYRLSVDQLCREIEPAVKSGIGGVLLFGLTEEEKKDPVGTEASHEGGAVQQAIGTLKKEFPELVVMTDVCLCAYTSHGHCGPLDPSGDVDNDRALERLAQIALSHARAGADCVAPSAMMDGQVAAIRRALSEEDFKDTLLMSYSTKFASSLYGPFREAEQSAPGKGDRQGYQQSYRDGRQALRESLMDEEEGADILMVKPGLFYLDILARLREATDLPLASYNVSGEFSMIHAAAQRGWGDLRGMARESVAALSRAGSDLIISYWANRYDELFRQD
ncbi:MAG: porphobilinogen synthase [Spirochaetales bacterium]|nr:porphobilinogen synthase [Spirochaetales bacterium]